MAARPCPSCRKADLDPASGACANCRGEWLAGPLLDAAAPGRLPLLRKRIARGPPTHLTCPWCRAALKAFDIEGWQYEGDLFWGHEKPRASGTCVGEGCAACGGVWMEAHELARGGGRRAVVEALARLAESLA